MLVKFVLFTGASSTLESTGDFYGSICADSTTKATELPQVKKQVEDGSYPVLLVPLIFTNYGTIDKPKVMSC